MTPERHLFVTEFCHFSAVVHDYKNQSQFKDRVKDGLPDI